MSNMILTRDWFLGAIASFFSVSKPRQFTHQTEYHEFQSDSGLLAAERDRQLN